MIFILHVLIVSLFSWLSCMQEDNVRNQRENVVLMIANAQTRLGIPVEVDPVRDYNYLLTN